MLSFSIIAILIKCNLGGLCVHINILEESTVHIVSLLLDGGAELEEILGHGLVGSSENVDETKPVSMCLYVSA